MIRSAEWVRGYFDGEGCVHFSHKPTRYGRNALLAVETTDLDLMQDLADTFTSWGIDTKLSVYPPKPDGKRTRGRVAVKRRRNIEVVLARIRPLSEKHESRLQELLMYWAAKDEHEAALARGVERARNRTDSQKAIAQTEGVTQKQLENRIAYLKRARVPTCQGPRYQLPRSSSLARIGLSAELPSEMLADDQRRC